MQGPTTGDIAAILEEWAPPSWAEPWDNVGLLVGDPGRPAGEILIALELTNAVTEEAVSTGAGLLVLHHPPIFRPLKALRFDTAAGWRLERLIGAGVGVYAAHTNLDQAAGGTNDMLAAAAGLTEHEVLMKAGEDRYLKLVVFVPRGHEDAVRSALSAAGAGHIGNYSHCTFQAAGTGTFLPLDGANPFLGERGTLEHADELRLETIVPESRSRETVRALVAAHPYEEVAYDLYPLANPGKGRGHGRIGLLGRPETPGVMAARLKAALGLPGLRLVGDPSRTVSRVAVGAGSGAMLIPHAARLGAEVLVTGDIGHHDAQEAADAGLCVLDVGHYASEAIVVGSVARHLREKLAANGLAGRVCESRSGKDPFLYR